MSRRKIFVGRLPLDITEREIEKIFQEYGRLSTFNVKYGRAFAYAFVEYDDPLDAEDAIKYENGRKIDGQRIAVEWISGFSYPRNVRSRNSGECYECHGRGHLARDCPELERGSYYGRHHRSRTRSRSPRRRSKRSYTCSRSRSSDRGRDHKRSKNDPNRNRRSPKESRSRSKTPSSSPSMRSNKEKQENENAHRRHKNPEESCKYISRGLLADGKDEASRSPSISQSSDDSTADKANNKYHGGNVSRGKSRPRSYSRSHSRSMSQDTEDSMSGEDDNDGSRSRKSKNRSRSRSR